MNTQRLNEKPFWWDYLHNEAKIKSPEEIHKFLVETGISEEQLKNISRNEKYMAMSQGCYIIDIKKIKDEKLSPIAGTAASLINSEPVALDLNYSGENNNNNYPPPIPQEVLDEAAKADKELEMLDNKKNDSDMLVTDEDMEKLENNIDKEDVFGKPTGSLNTKSDDTGLKADNKIELNGDKSNSLGVKNVAEIRKQAQSIVRNAVGQINEKADSIPDDVAEMKEQELLKAVIEELNSLKEKQ